MTAFHIKADACTGRGYAATDANGYLEKLKSWGIKIPNDGDPANRGPGWYLIDDQAALGTDPYVVFSDQASPTPNSRARIVQCLLPTVTASMVIFNWFFSWNTTTHVGKGLWSAYNIPTLDSGTFGYDFRGGPEFFWQASYIAGVLVWGACDTIERIPSLLEPASILSTLQNPFFKVSGNTSGYLSGFENITGITYTSGNTDAGFNLYFSIVSAGGSNFNIVIYIDSARTLQVAHTTSSFLNTATGAKALTTDNSSGVGGTITVAATVAANTTISCRFLQVEVAAGNGALYTAERNYYLFDATGASVIVSHLMVKAISGDTLTLEKYTAGKAFPTGALIGSYPHDFYTISKRNNQDTSNGKVARIPYCSAFGSEYAEMHPSSGTSNRRADLGQIESFMFAAVTDQYGNYLMQPGLICEFANSAGSSVMTNRRQYGSPKNFQFTHSTGLSIYSFGRTLNLKNFLDIEHVTVPINHWGSGELGFPPPLLALCVRDTAETV
jgi:hypothetical protein